MKTELIFTRALVRKILLSADPSEWTVQGFGFLRTYFGPPENPKRFRLNLWDSRFTVPNVSTIHDHPWDFSSLIVAGNFRNQRFDMQHPKLNDITPTHSYTTIRTGVGGGIIKSDMEHCVLIPQKLEYFMPGDTYGQRASEIHETQFEDGSITLNERVGDTEQARVFWPFMTEWVDAIPRPATTDEVAGAVARSLERWF